MLDVAGGEQFGLLEERIFADAMLPPAEVNPISRYEDSMMLGHPDFIIREN